MYAYEFFNFAIRPELLGFVQCHFTVPYTSFVYTVSGLKNTVLSF